MALKAQIMMGPLEKYKHYSKAYYLIRSNRPVPMEANDTYDHPDAFLCLSHHDHGIHW